MSQLFVDTSQSLSTDAGVLMGVVTALFMGMFAAWTWYAYAPSRRNLMNDFGRIPLSDGIGDANGDQG